MLQFASGSSDAVNSVTAVQDCLALAAAEDGSTDCDVLVFHTTVGHNYKQLLSVAREVCPSATIVGCSGSGVISAEGVSEKMRALAVMAIRGPETTVVFRDGLDGVNSQQLAEGAARQLHDSLPGVCMIYVMSSGLDVSGDAIIAGIEAVFGPDVPIIGGTAADNGKAKGTFQFHDDTITEHGLIMVGYADPTLELVTAIHHGSVPIGEPLTVTRSSDNIVTELDGEPAWATLLGRVGLPPDTPPGMQVLPVAGVGIELADEDKASYDNSHILRVPLRMADDGGIVFPSHVPEGTKLTLVQRDEDKIFAGVDRMMARMTATLDGARPVAVFQADCMARGRLTFNRVLKDEIIAKMQYPLCGEVNCPWLGLYGYSEFAPLNGKNQFHSYTTSLFSLVRRA